MILARFLWPLELPLPVKIALATLVIVALQYHQLCRLSSGSVFSPEFPRPLVILFNWALGAIVFLALLQILLDGGLLIAMLIHGGSVDVPDGVRYAMAASTAIAAAIGVQQATRVPPLKDIEIGIDGLPRQFDGYTILHLTDLHISRLFPATWARAVVKRSNQIGVDLIVITGDLVDGTIEARRLDIEPLRELHAPDGVYVTSGNHENIFGYHAWMAHYVAMGLRAIENEHVVLDRDGGKLTLVGVSDRSVRRRHRVPDLAATIKGAPSGHPTILLNHQPSEARQAAGAWGRSAVIRTYAWRPNHRHRPVCRACELRIRLGFLRGRRDDAVRQQRYRALAGLRAPSRPPVRAYADHAAPNGQAASFGLTSSPRAPFVS